MADEAKVPSGDPETVRTLRTLRQAAPGTMSNERIERTSSGLRDALFEAMEKLRNGDIEAGDAKGLAMLAREICNTVRLEMEVARLRNSYPADAKVQVPGPLNLVTAKK